MRYWYRTWLCKIPIHADLSVSMTSLRLPSSTLCVCSLPTSTLCVCSVPASTGHRTTVRSHHDWSSLFHALRMFSPLVHALRMFCTSVHWSSCNGPFPSRLELPLPRSAFVLSPRPRSAYVLYQRPLVIVQRSVSITIGALPTIFSQSRLTYKPESKRALNQPSNHPSYHEAPFHVPCSLFRCCLGHHH
jgi:hypothetical protein